MKVKKFEVVKSSAIVMSGLKNALFLLLILSTSSILKSQENHTDSFTSVSELEDIQGASVPLYENIFQDYRESQAIKYGVKWASVSSIPFTFSKMYNLDESEWLIKLFYISTVIAPPSFGVLGGFYGYWKGRKFNELKLSNPDFHTPKYTIGHETCFEKTFLSDNANYKLTDELRYSIAFQNYTKELYIPTEYRLGFTIKEWNEKNGVFWDSDENFFEKRVNFDVLFNSNKKLLNLHYGLGFGYSWTKHETEIDYDTTVSKNVDGSFFYPIAGITLNVNDFFYLRLESKYEFSDIFNKITDFYGAGHYSNFNLGFSFGTYLF